MANMAWNSSMNTSAVIDMLTDKGADGDYVIPRIIYSDAYSSEMVAYADLILPDTTYLERHDCISLLDRPICEAEALADAIRWPVVRPTAACAASSRCCWIWAIGWACRGWWGRGWQPAYADYADYMVRHERRPGVGPLAGWRGDGTQTGRGRPTRSRLTAISRTAASSSITSPRRRSSSSRGTPPIRTGRCRAGFYDAPQPYLFNLWLEPLRRFQLAAEGHGERQPPEHLRARIIARWTRCRSGIRPSRRRRWTTPPIRCTR
jgi:sulfite dehydrogenase (quinone) subunit SoeA